MHKYLFTVMLAALAPVPAFAEDEHLHSGDFELEVEDGAIHVHGERVLGGELGADTDFDGEIDTWNGRTTSPGFDSADFTFPSPSGVGFRIRGPVSAWDTIGGSFVTTDTRLRVEDPSDDTRFALSPLGGTEVEGPALGVDANGKFHQHWRFVLTDGNGDWVGSGNSAYFGIYLLELEMFSTSSSIADSDPIWVVFNYGADDLDHDAAIEWVEANLIPEPASLALLGAGVAVMGLRRRA